jgi:hypothetical protein
MKLEKKNIIFFKKQKKIIFNLIKRIEQNWNVLNKIFKTSWDFNLNKIYSDLFIF